MKTGLAVILLAGVAATPTFAEYYIVQDSTTRHCRIVEERPGPSIGTIVGTPFGVRTEAETHMRTVKVCHEETTGRGSDDVVVIEKRQRIDR